MTASIHLRVSGGTKVRKEQREEIGEGAKEQIATSPTIPSASKRSPFITAPAISKKTHPVEGCRSTDVFITLVLIICLTQQSLTSTPLI